MLEHGFIVVSGLWPGQCASNERDASFHSCSSVTLAVSLEVSLTDGGMQYPQRNVKYRLLPDGSGYGQEGFRNIHRGRCTRHRCLRYCGLNLQMILGQVLGAREDQTGVNQLVGGEMRCDLKAENRERKSGERLGMMTNCGIN